MMTLTAAGGAAVVFAAGGPGENLSPSSGAEEAIALRQVGETIHWASLAGNVTTTLTLTWPTGDGTHDLGGALVIERPGDTLSGSIDVGEKPMSVTFEMGS